MREQLVQLGIDLCDAPTLWRFYRSNAPVRLIVGPVGSGKSSVCCVETGMRRPSETPAQRDKVRRSRWAVVRNTYRELQDTTIKTFKEWIDKDAQNDLGYWHESSHTFFLDYALPDGTRVEGEVLFRALDRPEDVSKLLSLELTGCYFNEWKEIPRSVFEIMDTRVGRYPRADDVGGYCWTGIWGDTNPPDDQHYLYKLFEEDRPKGFELFRQPGGRSSEAENLTHLQRCPGASHHLRYKKTDGGYEPIEEPGHLDPCVCYYEKSARGKSKDFQKVMVDGEYGVLMDGKAIFPEFSDILHVAKEPIKVMEKALITIGNDYGLTPAAVWIQRDPRDGQIQVVREFVSERMGAVNFGAEQRRICKTEFRTNSFEGYGDPAGMAEAQTDERTPIDIINAAGVPMVAAPTNDLTVRWDAVRGLLLRNTWMARPAIVFSPTCKWLRKAMAGGYQLRRLQTNEDPPRYQEKPNKNEYSHVAEALQYALVGAGEDQSVLDGGQLNRVRVNVRVHRAVGGTVRPSGQDFGDDSAGRYRVQRSVRWR